MSRFVIATIFAAFLAITAVSANCIDKSGNKHKAGDEWTEKGTKSSTFDFTMRCVESESNQKTGTTNGNGTNFIMKNAWNVEVVGCVVPNSGEKLGVGQTATSDNKEWRCERGAGGVVTMHMMPKKGAFTGMQKAQKDGATPSAENTAAAATNQQENDSAEMRAQNSQKH